MLYGFLGGGLTLLIWVFLKRGYPRSLSSRTPTATCPYCDSEIPADKPICPECLDDVIECVDGESRRVVGFEDYMQIIKDGEVYREYPTPDWDVECYLEMERAREEYPDSKFGYNEVGKEVYEPVECFK